MDPRVAERRRAVRRQRSRRRRTQLLALFGIVALAGLSVAAVRSPLFSVTGVRVTGVSEQQADAVRQSADVAVGQNLLDVDLAAVESKVTALPWVREATARRVPPAAIALHVSPRKPMALVTWDEGAAVVDAEGIVISPRWRDGKGLVRISAEDVVVPAPGQPLTDPGVLEALRVHYALSGAVADRINRYTVSAGEHVVAHLRIGRGKQQRDVLVRFGSAERLGEKEQSLMALLVQLRARKALSDGLVIDVRAPSNPVVAPS